MAAIGYDVANKQIAPQSHAYNRAKYRLLAKIYKMYYAGNMVKPVTLAAALLVAILASPSFAGEKCKCRFNGGYIEEGQTACIKTPNGMSLARCEKVLNNTSWKTLNQPCPFASLAPQYGSRDSIAETRVQTPFLVQQANKNPAT